MGGHEEKNLQIKAHPPTPLISRGESHASMLKFDVNVWHKVCLYCLHGDVDACRSSDLDCPCSTTKRTVRPRQAVVQAFGEWSDETKRIESMRCFFND